MLIGGADGMCRGIDTALIDNGVGELVDERLLHVILRSNIAPRAGAVEI